MKTARTNIVARQIETRLGTITLARQGPDLAGLWFAGQKYDRHPYCQDDSCVWTDDPNDKQLGVMAEQLSGYFSGKRQQFSLPLRPVGTDFQQRVWQALQEIECGATVSYGQLAARIGKPAAVRAVAAAIGRNPVSIVIPCHRVVGADGKLTGYAGGIDRKQTLLAHEASMCVTE
jgi:methylated-DNA-[protein]-cysteine S-methyltransferase